MLDEATAPVPAEAASAKPAIERSTPASRRRAKLDVLRSWKPSVSHPALMREVALRSVYTQRLLSLTFFRAQIAVYQIGVMLPIFTSQEQGSAFESQLHEKLDSVRAELKGEIERLRKLRDDNGVDVTSIVYPDQEIQSVPLYTPEATLFLNMLLSFDEIVATADALWLSGLWRGVQRSNCIHYWRSRMVTFSRDINSLQVRARSAMRRHASQRASAMAAKELARQERRARIGSEAPATVGGVDETGSNAESSAASAAEPAADTVTELKPKRTRKKAAAEPVAMAAGA